MGLAGFEAALHHSDLVLTGEGRVDAQTRFGKTAQGVAEQARAAGVPCLCFGGGVTPEGAAVLAAAGAIAIPVVETPDHASRPPWRPGRARSSGRPSASPGS